MLVNWTISVIWLQNYITTVSDSTASSHECLIDLDTEEDALTAVPIHDHLITAVHWRSPNPPSGAAPLKSSTSHLRGYRKLCFS